MSRSVARYSSATLDDYSDFESLTSSDIDMSSISASTARSPGYSRDPSPVSLTTQPPATPCTRSIRWHFQPEMIVVRVSLFTFSPAWNHIFASWGLNGTILFTTGGRYGVPDPKRDPAPSRRHQVPSGLPCQQTSPGFLVRQPSRHRPQGARRVSLPPLPTVCA